MSLAQGVAAGLATGGRFSGLSNALKMVLKNQQLNSAMENRMNITREVSDRDMAIKMLAINQLGGAGEMPEEMKAAGYRQFGGKVYRTQNLRSPEKYSGENAAMEAGMLRANLKAIDELMRTPGIDQSTKVILQRRKSQIWNGYQEALRGSEGFEEAEAGPSALDKFMTYMGGVGNSASSMLGNAGNTIMDMLNQED